jgi:CheY-like chemotaxis protein
LISILLVDDSRVTREVTKICLIAKDVTLLDARNGEEALKLIREHKPDIVVADMQMPKLDGIALCAAIKGDPALAAIPVVILTSNLDAFSKARCLSAGAREVLHKPVEPAALIASIKRQLVGRSLPY